MKHIGISLAAALLLLVMAACRGVSAPPVENETRLNNDARLEYVNIFQKCGHRTIESGSAGQLTGATRNELETSQKSLRVTSFASEQATIERYVDGYCPAHYLLKITGKSLKIYRTDGVTLEQKEKMTINFDLDKLSGETRQALTKGIIFESLEEIEHYIEDMDS